MAKANRICAIAECGKIADASRGMCQMHYRRWRVHGDPNFSKTTYPRRGEVQAFISETLASCTDDCIAWPFFRDKQGRGHIRRNGKGVLASRHICRLAHGDPPSPQHEAAHSCGKSHQGCVNPRHLRWATHRENEADKTLHGTSQHGQRNHQAKLTECQVMEIRSLKGVISQRAIAQQYEVAQTLVSLIHRGARWGWLESQDHT